MLGLSQAITDMLNDSEKAGLERGEKLSLELCRRLMEAGRMDDMKRVFTDQEFRESLYEKYGIQK